jgi:hypothetical protein
MLTRDIDSGTFVHTTNPQPFVTLLSSLRTHAGKAKFRRLHELRRVIERARLVEAHRDIIFQSPIASEAALRSAAIELERLDAAFIGLCVEHVLESHARAGLKAAATVQSAHTRIEPQSERGF